MKLAFEGECSELLSGINALSQKLGYEVSENAEYTVFVKKENGGLKVDKNQKNVEISYEEKIHFFRALGLLIEKINEDTFKINEKPHFKTVGVMLDASRGQVPNVKNIKMFLEYMAIMGMNLMMLYTEETYEIESEPYFGYLRGRYTKDELRECDLYALQFGIEMVPCIQTLGHMEQFLKWPDALKYADTEKVLLTDDETTYDFIERAIVSASEPFTSKRIHIGMDEVNDIGLGKYLKKNGYTNRLEIMNRHVQRVSEIARKHSLKPMIWSDMYLHMSELDSGVDENSAENAISQISPDTQFVFWDYYREDKNRYIEKIQKHKRMGRIPVFAGGIWCWTSYGTDYDKTFKTTAPALAACREEGVSEVIATMWGCAETLFLPSLMGFSYFAENTYLPEFDMERFKQRVQFCTGIPYEDFYELTRLYKIDGQFNQEEEPPNPSSSLLWQDVLMGMYDGEMKDIPVEEHYKACAEIFDKASKGSALRNLIFSVPAQLSKVLSVKGEIGLKLKKAYDEKDKAALSKIANTDLMWLKDAVDTLRSEHRRVYLECNKPFGFDLVDVRYGGVIARIDTAIYRINDYLDGNVELIEELEEERLPFDPTGDYFLHWRKYSHISVPHTTKYSLG